jgi:hypothetical protein
MFGRTFGESLLYSKTGINKSITTVTKGCKHLTKISPFFPFPFSMRNTADVTGGNPIAVLLQSISGVINPLVAFCDIYGGKREVLFFYFVPDTTRDFNDTLTTQLLEFPKNGCYSAREINASRRAATSRSKL